MLRGSVALALLFWWQQGATGGLAVRIADLGELSGALEEEEQPTPYPAACLDSLRPIVRATSIRELLRPVLDGTYRLRKKDTDLYLSLDSGGGLYLTPEARKRTQWRLKRQPQGRWTVHLPSFTLRHVASRRYLVGQGETPKSAGRVARSTELGKSASLWRPRLGSSGKYFALENTQDGTYLAYLQVEGTTRGVEALGVDPSLVGWDLELVKAPWFNRVKSKKIEFIQQLKIATDIPMIPESRSRMTWAKMCDPETEACQQFFLGQRERISRLGLLEEDEHNVVTEVKVQGLCDLHPANLRTLLTSRFIVQDLYATDAGSSCSLSKLSDFSRALRQVVVEECFAECISAAEAMVPEILETNQGPALKCDARPDTNFTTFFEKLINSNAQCGGLPSDSVEAIGDHVIQQRCWTFVNPGNLLWRWNDQMPQNLDTHDHTAACTVYQYDAMKSQSAKDIFQHGACPEGTRCKCPETWVSDWETVYDIRQQGELSHFIAQGSARLPSLLSQFARRALVGSAKQVLKGSLLRLTLAATGLALGSTALFVPSALIVSASMGLKTKLTLERAQWRCAHTVGCWPVQAKRMSNGSHYHCRMGEDAQQGGSPVWFMPPPGLEIAKVKLRGGLREACKVRVCSAGDTRRQRVGFGGSEDTGHEDVNVYNCQPLNYVDMTQEQQSTFVTMLSDTGVFKEYPYPSTRSMHLEPISAQTDFWAQTVPLDV